MAVEMPVYDKRSRDRNGIGQPIELNEWMELVQLCLSWEKL